MIIDSFDIKSEAIITPASFFGEKSKIYDIAIATFSREIFPAVLKLFPNEKIAFYLSEIGASLSGTDIIEVNWITGAEKFILFGSAGSLDNKKTKGKSLTPASR